MKNIVFGSVIFFLYIVFMIMLLVTSCSSTSNWHDAGYQKRRAKKIQKENRKKQRSINYEKRYGNGGYYW